MSFINYDLIMLNELYVVLYFAPLFQEIGFTARKILLNQSSNFQ